MNHMTAPSPAIARKLAQLACMNANIEGFEHEITVVRQNGKTDLSNAKIITGEEAIPPVGSCKHAQRQPHPPFPPAI